ncbi:hypothetical protein FQZ97_1188210 [compost metagenome]
MFEAEQDARFASDAWEFRVVRYLEDHIGEYVTGDVLLEKALNLEPGHWGKPEQTRLGQVMHRVGWRRKRLPSLSKYGVRGYGYVRPAAWMKGQMALQQREPVL